MATVYAVDSSKLTCGWTNTIVLPVQAKRQFFEPAQSFRAGESANRFSTESWFMGRSKLMLIAWLVGTSVTSRLGEMLTIRGGLRAHPLKRQASTASVRRMARRITRYEEGEISG